MESTKTISEMGKGLVHPCFLYESVWCIAGFFLLNYISKKRRFSGQVTLWYGVWYGFGRAIIELLRTDSLMIGSIRVSCLVSILACLGSAAVLAVMRKKDKASLKEEEEYTSVFTDAETDKNSEGQDGEDE